MIFLCFFCFFLSTVFAQQHHSELLNRKLIEEFAGEISGKICLEHIRDLSVLRRYYGSDDMEKGAKWIADNASSQAVASIILLVIIIGAIFFVTIPKGTTKSKEKKEV